MSEPTAQIPTSASRTPATAEASSGSKNSTNVGSATMCGKQEDERRKRLPQPDGAAIARREHEAVEHPVLLLGYPRGQPEERGEHDRHPEQAVRCRLARPLGQCEMEHDERRQDRSIAGSVSRPRSSTRRSLRVSAATSARYVTRAPLSPWRAVRVAPGRAWRRRACVIRRARRARGRAAPRRPRPGRSTARRE